MPNPSYEKELPLQDLHSATAAAKESLDAAEIRAALAEIEESKAVSQEIMFFEFSV